MEEEDISDEEVWKAQFEATTDTQWDSLAEIVRQEIAAGDIIFGDRPKPPQIPCTRAHRLLEIPR